MTHFKDITNKTFGEWTVIKRVENDKYGGTQWLCKCSCGTIKTVKGNNLIRGISTNCGCIRIKNLKKIKTIHNKSNNRLYKIWQDIKRRCYNPNRESYQYYGKRGIKMCEEWLSDFRSFYQWSINNGYTNKLSIDRIDVNGNYEPSNCRWATSKEQNRNKRNNKFLEYNGEVHCLVDWCEILGLKYKTTLERLLAGWSTKRAFEEPIKNFKP